MDTPSHPRAGTNTIVVTLPIEIDITNADQVRADLDAAFRPSVGVVIADMTGTRFCDTSGMHALVTAHTRAQKDHAELRVVAGPGEVRHLLATMGLDTVLTIYQWLDEALTASNGQPA